MPSDIRSKVQILLLFIIGCLFSQPGHSQATIYSNGTGGGDFSNTTSWTGGGVPTAVDTAILLSGDTITVSVVDGAVFVAGLQIQSNAVFWNVDRRVSIFGHYLNNGEHRSDYGNYSQINYRQRTCKRD